MGIGSGAAGRDEEPVPGTRRPPNSLATWASRRALLKNTERRRSGRGTGLQTSTFVTSVNQQMLRTASQVPSQSKLTSQRVHVSVQSLVGLASEMASTSGAASFPVLATLKLHKGLLLASECPTFYEHVHDVLVAWARHCGTG